MVWDQLFMKWNTISSEYKTKSYQDYVRQTQGLEAGRNTLRQMPHHLPRRNRHVLVMSPEPMSVIETSFTRYRTDDTLFIKRVDSIILLLFFLYHAYAIPTGPRSNDIDKSIRLTINFSVNRNKMEAIIIVFPKTKDFVLSQSVFENGNTNVIIAI